MTQAYVNILVALTSLVALCPIYKSIQARSVGGFVISLLLCITSILQHLSETKHNLPGVYFSKYAGIFLLLDRLWSFVAIIYGLCQLVAYPHLLTCEFVDTATFGLVCLFIGENILTEPFWHLIFHPFWHCCAFSCLAHVIVPK